MGIYRLSNELIFPHPKGADQEGLLAVGGDLSVQRLLLAYQNGIFPWYSEGQPILWWSPDPRFVLFPKDIRISTSMKKILKKGIFTITLDTAFRQVIKQCGAQRKEEGTWITKNMIEAYCSLHELGFAHSIEAWYENNLVGGLYGISLGKCFFGESMFCTISNASKAAFITLTQILHQKAFHIIDCQVHTEHLQSLGAVHIPRQEFLLKLDQGVCEESFIGSWSSFIQ